MEVCFVCSVRPRLVFKFLLKKCLYRVFEASLTNQRFLAPCMIVQFAVLILNGLFNYLFVFVLNWGYVGSVFGTALVVKTKSEMLFLLFKQ
jgi:Na+-driven multidrug efflux pump